MPSSTNDVRVRRKSFLYRLATTINIFDLAYSDKRFAHYLIENKGYLLYCWLETPYRVFEGRGGECIEQKVYNRKLISGRVIVKNVVGIFKGVFYSFVSFCK